MGRQQREAAKAAKAASAAQSVGGPPVSASTPAALRHFGLALLLLMVAGAFFKFYRLDYPPSYVFDEIYHAQTAKLYLHGDKRAYDPWGKKDAPDQHFEWTHPPLAKLLMAGFMKVYGEDSFGWRVGSVVFGAMAIGLTALLALHLFGSPVIALASAGFLTIEGLFFVQSRLAMNDPYFVCFALAACLFYVRWRQWGRLRDLYLAGLGLGLAAATKWTAAYLVPIVVVDLARSYFWKRDLRRGFPIDHAAVAFVLVPIAVYLLSYGQYFWMGYSWSQFEELQRQMLSYHSGLTATHQYQSRVWQWILNLRPVWMHGGAAAPGMSANIYNLGNSVILIGGLGLVVREYWVDRGRTWASWFAIFAYFMLWAPWAFSPRIMFFYHYTPAVPFLCILFARGLARLDGEPRRLAGWFLPGGLALSLLFFAVFYPRLTGMEVPEGFARSVYELLPGWK